MQPEPRVQEFLEHYGKRGMKWGVRNRRPTVGRQPAKESTDSKQVAKLRGRNPRELTNRQLSIANKRLNLEQNYSRLNPGTVARGTAKATAILATLGVAVTAYNMATSPAGKAAIKAGKGLVEKMK